MQNHTSPADPVLRTMFAARKRVFVDLLKWDVPVLEGVYEIDQFDTSEASYVILTDDKDSHRASARLLKTDRAHILGELFPSLCDGPVPVREDFREITRFCIEPTLSRLERRAARDELVTALADHALIAGIAAYTAVATLNWFRQIAKFGWRCRALGPGSRIGGENLIALQIDIDAQTPADLACGGIYRQGSYRVADYELEIAA
ncbi:acyl-homoserine-lactone synthase [Pelagerythrobacter aerophilus]|uniref:Acyl-homoserine-lactone synthase n=1 Tax=Pelagerythrobacter aerophilus TaxID=2306995 RepID=A0A418NKL3_9SPHN|nr:acyl-homoserine-lactone synthase [Pelagerythrobacter aerophilus]RIV80241.1 autoinducer synthase [Pelagerythrobacter aerophilus]